MSTYTGVSNFQKTVRFFLAHTVYALRSEKNNPFLSRIQKYQRIRLEITDVITFQASANISFNFWKIYGPIGGWQLQM